MIFGRSNADETSQDFFYVSQLAVGANASPEKFGHVVNISTSLVSPALSQGVPGSLFKPNQGQALEVRHTSPWRLNLRAEGYSLQCHCARVL